MLESFGATDPGCVRQNNEDYFLLAPDIGLYVVADGMGGAQAGEHASRMATQIVNERVRQSPVRDENTLVQSIQEANLAVMEAAARNAQLEGMGTTLVAALDSRGGRVNSSGSRQLWIASVGDSRAYVCDQGEVTEITEDQTWVNEVGRRLGLDEDKLRSHPMRHVLTMAVGVSQPLRINTYTLPLSAGMQLLLCSDGLHGVVNHEVLSEVLQDESRTLEAKCKQLIALARGAGGPDNITAVVLRSS